MIDKAKTKQLKEMFSAHGSFETLAARILETVNLSFWGDLDYKKAEARSMVAIKMVPPVNYKTEKEISRRVNICIDWIMKFRCDLKWSLSRISDTLSIALRKSLDGSNWEPNEDKGTWFKPEMI